MAETDVISRQAFKDAMYHEAFETDTEMQRWDSGCWIRYKLFENVIENLPSAEPQIIQCKDCKHYVRTPFLGTGYDYGKCGSPYIDAVMKPDGYCSFAERREEE